MYVVRAVTMLKGHKETKGPIVIILHVGHTLPELLRPSVLRVKYEW